MRKIAKRGLYRALGALGGKKAGFSAVLRFQQDAAGRTVDPICGGGAVVGAHGPEIPIGIRDHMDAAVMVHENRQIAIVRSRRAGGGEDLFGVPEKRAHKNSYRSAGAIF